MKTDDDVLIRIVNKGVGNGGRPAAAPSASAEPFFMFTHPEFEAPAGKDDWLNRSMFVGTLGAHIGARRIGPRWSVMSRFTSIDVRPSGSSDSKDRCFRLRYLIGIWQYLSLPGALESRHSAHCATTILRINRILLPESP